MANHIGDIRKTVVPSSSHPASSRWEFLWGPIYQRCGSVDRVRRIVRRFLFIVRHPTQDRHCGEMGVFPPSCPGSGIISPDPAQRPPYSTSPSPPTQIITPLLIIFRISQGRAWSHDTHSAVLSAFANQTSTSNNVTFPEGTLSSGVIGSTETETQKSSL